MSCIRQLTKRLYPAHPAAGVEKRAYSLKEKDMETVAELLDTALMNRADENRLSKIKDQVKEFSLKFLVPGID